LGSLDWGDALGVAIWHVWYAGRFGLILKAADS
jgi:hypothetical protein